jgi:hypothetical protein
LSKAFSASIEMTIFFVFDFMCYVYWFAYVESSLHHWNEASLIMVDDLFNYCWILSSLKIHASIFIKEICLWFSFQFFFPPFLSSFFSCFCIIIQLSIRVILDHRMSLDTFLPFLSDGIIWGALILFKGQVEFSSKSTWSWVTVTASISLINWSNLFRLFICSWFSFSREYVPRYLSISLDFPIY